MREYPQANMLLVSKNSEQTRRTLMHSEPPGLSIINSKDLEVVDQFFMDTQEMRDYYRDPCNKLHRPVSFQTHWGKCGDRRWNWEVNRLMQPCIWVRERRPIVCPVYYDNSKLTGPNFRLGGSYSPKTCSLYKR